MSKTKNGVIIPPLRPRIIPFLNVGSLVEQIPEGAITTKDGKMIVLTTAGDYILTVNGFIPLDALRTINGDVVKTKNLEFITT